MILQQTFSQWLAHSAIFGAVLLAVGAIALRCFRQPVHRVRIVQWTFISCLLVPLLQTTQFAPAHSLGLLDSHDTVTAPEAIPRRSSRSETMPVTTASTLDPVPTVNLVPGTQPGVSSDEQAIPGTTDIAAPTAESFSRTMPDLWTLI